MYTLYSLTQITHLKFARPQFIVSKSSDSGNDGFQKIFIKIFIDL